MRGSARADLSEKLLGLLREYLLDGAPIGSGICGRRGAVFERWDRVSISWLAVLGSLPVPASSRWRCTSWAFCGWTVGAWRSARKPLTAFGRPPLGVVASPPWGRRASAAQAKSSPPQEGREKEKDLMNSITLVGR